MIHVLGRRVLAALFAVVPTAGLAGPPYITDDTERNALRRRYKRGFA